MSGGGWLVLVIVIVIVIVIGYFLRSRSGGSSGPAEPVVRLNPQPLPPVTTEPVAGPAEAGLAAAVPTEPPAALARPTAAAGPSDAERAKTASDESAAAYEMYVPGPAREAAVSAPGAEPAPAGSADGRPLDVGAVPALAALDTGGVAAAGLGMTSGAAAAVAAVVTQPGPYAGSALPTADGSAPSVEYTIKGNAGSNKYHPEDSPYFHRTRAEVWFSSAADAEAAGFVPWNGKSVAG